MVTVLLIGAVIGLVVGTFAGYVRLQHGWKPAFAIALALAACVSVVIEVTSLDGTAAVGAMLAFAATQPLVKPASRGITFAARTQEHVMNDPADSLTHTHRGRVVERAF